MDSVTLTQLEIRRITGKVQPAAQIRHLRRMGIKAERSDNPEDPVVVCRAWLSAKPETAPQSRPRLKSDRVQAAHTP